MILFLILLIVAAAIVGLYATENSGAHDVTLWQWHWSAVPDWAPVLIAAALVGALFLLYMTYSGMVHGVRVGSMRRRVSTRESAINDLRRENQRLREENARVRSELRGTDRGVAAATDGGTVVTPDRGRTAPSFRPRPTFGERVRAFFSGREPAGY
jgi:uncharacterized integral membrane protein